MKFSEAKLKAIQALLAGDYRLEVRNDLAQNQLATDQINGLQAAEILRKARGPGERSKHHFLDVDVWVLKPDNWYIKFYFLDQCWFISFHTQAKEAP